MLTLITDSSFGFLDPNTNETNARAPAGWGAWVKADGMPSQFDGGIIDMSVNTPQEAELASILYGLRMAIAYAPGHNVMLQNDCVHALRLIRYRLGWPESKHPDGIRVGNSPMLKRSPREQNLLAELSWIVGPAKLVVTVRHVKGHVAGAKGRHWVNERCDAIARGHMRVARRRMGVPGV